MNTTVIAVIVGALVVGGGGYYVYTQSSSSAEVSQEATSGTFASLLTSGKNLACTFEYNDGGANVSSGTVYMAEGGKRIRGDFSITQSALGAMEMHMIRDGGFNYLWGSTMPSGIKVAVTAEDEGKLFDAQEGPGIDDNTTFNCTTWSVDASKFSLPSGIEFVDLSALIPGASASGSATVDIKAQQCAACQMVPAGTARTQCLQALSC